MPPPTGVKAASHLEELRRAGEEGRRNIWQEAVFELEPYNTRFALPLVKV